MPNSSRLRRTASLGPIIACTLLAIATPAAAAPKELYATDYVASGAVAEFTFGAGGELAANGSATGTGNDPWYEAATPNGRYLYVVNYNGASVAQYDINSNGSLTAMSQPTVTVGSEPIGIAVSPNGKYVYVSNYTSGTISILDVGPTGALTPDPAQPTESMDLDGPYEVAVSPDGKSLYVPNYTVAEVVEFNIASNGTLSPKPTATVGTGTGPDFLVLTPDGKHAYVTNYSDATISQYSVGSGGQLAALRTPISAGTTDQIYQAAISPDGKDLYTGTQNAIYQFTVGSNGTLAPKTPAFVPAGPGAEDVWLTANGKYAYAANYTQSGDGTVGEYRVGTAGGLTALPTASIDGGASTAAVMIAPDQGPVAAFTVLAGAAGQATHFNGSGSKDSDGTIARYAWSFGDGTSAPSGGATPAHTYAKPGKYTVELTVTDDSGCSTSFVFTGSVAYCNGGPAAQLKKTVTIPAARPGVSTGAATSIIKHAATLTGTVNPHGSATTYRFQYGTTAHYGSQTTEASARSGPAARSVSARISGLQAGKTYFFRLLATDSAGTTDGPGRTFKTG
jgi:6-phosphogluconolactonase (cycloisomerase 2 family)